MPHFWMDSELNERIEVVFLTPGGIANLMGETKLSIYHYLDKKLTSGLNIVYMGEHNKDEVFLSVTNKYQPQADESVGSAIAHTGFDQVEEFICSGSTQLQANKQDVMAPLKRRSKSLSDPPLPSTQSVEITEDDVKWMSSVGMKWFVWKEGV